MNDTCSIMQWRIHVQWFGFVFSVDDLSLEEAKVNVIDLVGVTIFVKEYLYMTL